MSVVLYTKHDLEELAMVLISPLFSHISYSHR